MFVNARTGRPYSHHALRAAWLRGCKAAGFPPVPFYQGTKHSGASDMLERSGGDMRAVADFLGQSDMKSTQRYAKTKVGKLIELARGAGGNGPDGQSRE